MSSAATSRHTLRIGVFGSAFLWSPESETIAYQLGAAIARRGCITVTGATTGLPYRAGLGALNEGGFVLGISPAANEKEHVDRYGKPTDGCSLIVWTGSGYTGRNYLNLRNCDGAIFVGGETGTLEEFCIGNYEGKVIGILEGSGGVADKIRDLMTVCQSDHGAVIKYDRSPSTLVDSVIDGLFGQAACSPRQN